jgi:hypothetical protein
MDGSYFFIRGEGGQKGGIGKWEGSKSSAIFRVEMLRPCSMFNPP